MCCVVLHESWRRILYLEHSTSNLSSRGDPTESWVRVSWEWRGDLTESWVRVSWEFFDNIFSWTCPRTPIGGQCRLARSHTLWERSVLVMDAVQLPLPDIMARAAFLIASSELVSTIRCSSRVLLRPWGWTRSLLSQRHTTGPLWTTSRISNVLIRVKHFYKFLFHFPLKFDGREFFEGEGVQN